jgi:hypothetical protein
LLEHRVPVEIKKLLLATGEHADIDGLCGVDTHSLKRGVMCDRRDDERTIIPIKKCGRAADIGVLRM